MFEGKSGKSRILSGKEFLTFDGFAYLDPHLIFQLYVEKNFYPKDHFQTILSATGERTFQNSFSCNFKK